VGLRYIPGIRGLPFWSSELREFLKSGPPEDSSDFGIAAEDLKAGG